MVVVVDDGRWKRGEKEGKKFAVSEHCSWGTCSK